MKPCRAATLLLALLLCACGAAAPQSAPPAAPTISALKTDIARLKTRVAPASNVGTPPPVKPVQPTPTSQLAREIVSPQDLMVYLNFEDRGGETLTDLTGHGYNGVVRGAQFFAQGARGAAYQFDGVDDYVLVPASPGLNLNVWMTVSIYFRAEDYLAPQPLVEWNSGNRAGSLMWVNASGFDWSDGGTGVNLVSAIGDESSHVVSIPNPTVGDWHHLAVTYDADSGAVQIYLDGKLAREETIGRFEPQTSYDLYLGFHPTQPQAHFKGWMDELRIYQRVLTPKEITDLYYFGRESLGTR